MKTGFFVAAGAVIALASSPVLAADPWVERPLTLGTGRINVEAGLGIGQMDSGSGVKAATGSNLEAAVGLPFVGELRVRTGFRFAHLPDPNDKSFNVFPVYEHPDYFARTFDHETSNLGYGSFANPEISLRGSIVDAEIAAVGLETRVVVPIDQSSSLSVSPGLPVRFRIPKLVRIDTGIFAPINPDAITDYTVSVPVQLWFQVDQAFFGPMTGIRYSKLSSGDPNSRTDITAGIGGGYTIAERIDLKAQIYVPRINDASFSKWLGGGVGIGLWLP